MSVDNSKWLEKSKIIAAFAAIYIIWGSSFYGVLTALKSFPPFLMSALRFLIAGIALLIVCAVKKEPWPNAADLKKNMFCGIVLFMGGVVTVAWAQQFIPSSFASIIITTPFWFVILDKKQWAFYFSDKWLIMGLILGLLGVILLLGNRAGRVGIGDEKAQLMSILLIIFGSFLWVSGSLYLKYQTLKTSSYVNTCIQLLTAGIVCFVVSWARQEPQNLDIQHVQTASVVAIFYLSLVSSLITFMAYMWLIKVRPPAIVSTYSYVNPVVAVLLGWGFAGESMSVVQILGLFIILSGVFLVNFQKYKTLQE
jgi:drug/metabolite transporter (DMT)-like permease